MKLCKSGLLAAAALVGLSACAIRQDVVPVSLAQTDEMCVVHNEAVKRDVEAVVVAVLREKGMETRVVSDFNDPSCVNKLTYLARWSWDVTTYMSVAELKVYEDGKPAGEAIYNAKGGGANMGKFIKAEPKLRELMDELFPAT